MNLKNASEVPSEYRKYYNYTESLFNIGENPKDMFPKEAIIEVTNKCNLRCLMCGKGTWHKYHESDLDHGDLTNTLVKSLISELKDVGVEVIVLYGGEAVLREDLLDILKHIKSLNMWSVLATNAAVYNEEVIKFVLENGWDINFSFDGSTANIHDKISGRKGAFYGIVENILKILEMKKRMKSSSNILNEITIQKENVADIENIVGILDGWGIDEITCHFIETTKDRMDKESVKKLKQFLEKYKNGNYNDTRVCEAVDSNKGYLEGLYDGSISEEDIIEGMQARSLFQNRKTCCFASCDVVLINAFGNVYPCCHTFEIEEKDSEEYLMGNILNTSFREVWNSNRANQIRRKVFPVDYSKNKLSKCGACSNFFKFKEIEDNIFDYQKL